ncbi:uncharacterized protein [Panulirus ornatus]|uniref:uncharacterized protein n=1 Tax=Panulirus ornatus TaxID=150431 RepID=UPI003A8B38B2
METLIRVDSLSEGFSGGILANGSPTSDRGIDVPSSTQATDAPSSTQAIDAPSSTQATEPLGSTHATDPPSNSQDTNSVSNIQEPPSSTQKNREDAGSVGSSSSDGSALRIPRDTREHLQHILSSTPCQVTVVGLVLVDAALVVAVLLLELDHNTRRSLAPIVLHNLSLALLCLFFVEILLKIYAYQFEYFTHKAEVFDGLVVTVALCLDIVYIHSEDAHAGFGLLIVLRLWRVVRIQHGSSGYSTVSLPGSSGYSTVSVTARVVRIQHGVSLPGSSGYSTVSVTARVVRIQHGKCHCQGRQDTARIQTCEIGYNYVTAVSGGSVCTPDCIKLLCDITSVLVSQHTC